MSVPSPSAAPAIALSVPAYCGTTPSGERALGADADYVTQTLLRYSQARPAAESTSKLIEPRTSQALADFSALEATLRSLLVELPESDEFGPARPARESIDTARRTLFQLVATGFTFPKTVDIGTDHDGALRIVWENRERFLELVVPYGRDAEPYLYYSQGAEYGIQRDFAVDALRKRFNWLSS